MIVAKYSRCPLTEAAIDIQVSPADNLSQEDCVAARGDLSQAFPHAVDLQQFSFGFKVAADGKPQSEQTAGLAGMAFTSADKKLIWQARYTGCTVSQLAPYQGWEAFSGIAKPAWLNYRATTRPKLITRVAVRYINRIDIPLPMRDFKDYLLTVPEIAPGIPQALSGMLMQVQIPLVDELAMLRVTETMVPPDRTDIVSIVLDIDIFRDNNVPQEEGEVWSCLDQLRKVKNAVFESCITDATRALII